MSNIQVLTVIIVLSNESLVKHNLDVYLIKRVTVRK